MPKTPAKKKPTAITKRDRTLSSVKNAADTSQMKRLLDAVGGLGAIAGPTPAAKRSLRRGLGFGSTSSRKSRKVVATVYVGPPQKGWHFAPDRLRPQRPVPIEYRGGFACPCCTKQDGSPFFMMQRKKQKEILATKGSLRGKPCGVFSKPYPEIQWNGHLTYRHGFPSQAHESTKAMAKRRGWPGHGKGMGGNTGNPGGGFGPIVHPHDEVWVWVYGKGWEVQKIQIR